MSKFFVVRALHLMSKDESKTFMEKRGIKQVIKSYLTVLEGTEKFESIQLLGTFEENWVISFLTSFLKDTNPEIRLSVLNAIYNSPIENVLEKIAFLLIDEDPAIRKATVRLFEELAPEKYQQKTSCQKSEDKFSSHQLFRDKIRNCRRG